MAEEAGGGGNLKGFLNWKSWMADLLEPFFLDPIQPRRLEFALLRSFLSPIVLFLGDSYEVWGVFPGERGGFFDF